MARKPHGRHRSSSERRQRIVKAALACFVELGFANTTMEDIRRRSKASNGSIYHHFTSKELLAAAVYLQGLIDYQTGLLAELEHNPQAHAGVSAIVSYHLRWVTEHRDWARYLSEMRHAEFMVTAETAIAEQNRRFVKRLIGWLQPHIENGALRRLAPDLFISLIIGPCQEYARLWLIGRTLTGLSTAAEELGRAAWLAVCGPGEG
ncbi:MAG: TetR/AcrR family transcriptional regulator [Candidatus Hydrogenedentota bacterium]|nr:MAG: TetR/AcrR family transcriptional regulator [Candidatus Hydrogenedentota bacterium]